MIIDALDQEIDFAITASKEAGKLLVNNRNDLNDEILTNSKDIK